MKSKNILDGILDKARRGRKSYWVLLDPDDFSPVKGAKIAKLAEGAGVHALLIGSSLIVISWSFSLSLLHPD